FQRSDTMGKTSPKPKTESLMLSERANGIVPSGVVKVPASVPASDVLTRAYDTIAPTLAWPLKTGVAKVYIGSAQPRSDGAWRVALKFALRLMGMRPIVISRARATSDPADTLV